MKHHSSHEDITFLLSSYMELEPTASFYSAVSTPLYHLITDKFHSFLTTRRLPPTFANLLDNFLIF